MAQLAQKAGTQVAEVTNVAIWGNHSSTQYPDFENARIGGKPAVEVLDSRGWLEGTFIETVQKRGAAIIAARGTSSAASAANAVLDHVRSLITRTPKGDWFSAAVPSDGNPYGVPEGLIYGFPCTSEGEGDFTIVEGIELSDFARGKLEITTQELLAERNDVQELL
jgi:malate dehydrogenase